MCVFRLERWRESLKVMQWRTKWRKLLPLFVPNDQGEPKMVWNRHRDGYEERGELATGTENQTMGSRVHSQIVQ